MGVRGAHSLFLQTSEELMANCEFVDPRVQVDEAKQIMDFMDTNNDNIVRAANCRPVACGRLS